MKRQGLRVGKKQFGQELAKTRSRKSKILVGWMCQAHLKPSKEGHVFRGMALKENTAIVGDVWKSSSMKPDFSGLWAIIRSLDLTLTGQIWKQRKDMDGTHGLIHFSEFFSQEKKDISKEYFFDLTYDRNKFSSPTEEGMSKVTPVRCMWVSSVMEGKQCFCNQDPSV